MLATAPAVPAPVPSDTTPPTITIDDNVSLSTPTTATLTGTVATMSGWLRSRCSRATTALGAATVNPDGTWSFTDDFAPGFHTGISAVATDTSGNSASAPSDFDLTTGTSSGIPGQPYTAYQDRYAADGTFLGQTFFKANGAELFSSTYTALPDGGSSYTYSGGTLLPRQELFVLRQHLRCEWHTDRGHLQQSQRLAHDRHLHDRGGRERPAGAQHPQRSVRQRCAEHALRVLERVRPRHDRGLQGGGPGHDTLVLPSFDMGHLAQIIAGAHTVNGDTTIQVDKQDTITLVGVTKAELKAHPDDFKFHA